MSFIALQLLITFIDWLKGRGTIAADCYIPRMVLTIIWIALWFRSVTLWSSNGEYDFSYAPPPSGKFGVGAQSVFSEDGIHLLVYYPIERSEYDEAVKKQENRLPYWILGGKKAGVAE